MRRAYGKQWLTLGIKSRILFKNNNVPAPMWMDGVCLCSRNQLMVAMGINRSRAHSGHFYTFSIFIFLCREHITENRSTNWVIVPPYSLERTRIQISSVVVYLHGGDTISIILIASDFFRSIFNADCTLFSQDMQWWRRTYTWRRALQHSRCPNGIRRILLIPFLFDCKESVYYH